MMFEFFAAAAITLVGIVAMMLRAQLTDNIFDATELDENGNKIVSQISMQYRNDDGSIETYEIYLKGKTTRAATHGEKRLAFNAERLTSDFPLTFWADQVMSAEDMRTGKKIDNFIEFLETS